MIRKVAICGSGLQAERHLSYFLDHHYIVAGVKGSSVERIRYLEKNYRVPIYSTVEELLRINPAELVVVASKPNEHKTDVVQAINNGVRYLIIEKPLAASVEEAREIRDLVHQNNILASIVYHKRFQKAYQYLKELKENKKYGELNSISANISFPRNVDVTKYPFKWWLDKGVSGGGAIFQVGIHWINFIFGLIGYDMKLKMGHIDLNEHQLDEALSAIWVDENDLGINLFMTSCLTQQFTSIIFHFQGADLIYFNDEIIPVVKNNKYMCRRNPISFLKRITGKSSHVSGALSVKDGASPTREYLHAVLESGLNDSESRRLVDDSVADIELLHEVFDQS